MELLRKIDYQFYKDPSKSQFYYEMTLGAVTAALQVLLHLTREEALHMWHALNLTLVLLPHSMKHGCFRVHQQR